eukprot:scaffold649839_cov45-Prasinocladus_malaysianus.AAC.1
MHSSVASSSGLKEGATDGMASRWLRGRLRRVARDVTVATGPSAGRTVSRAPFPAITCRSVTLVLVNT